MRHVGRVVAGSLALLGAAPGATRRPPPEGRAVPRTTLVVLIAVDQLRPDYLTRYASQLTGGLGFLRTHGAFFPNAMQDHAITETAPGHATMLSGREPVHTGIMTNGRGVQDPLAPLLTAAGGIGASPRRFHGTTLYDWMLAADSGARVLSISRKDRAAIFPIGRARGSVFWWADGQFTTSRYYGDTLPAWLRAFNARGGVTRLAGTSWTPLLPDSAYAEPDSVPYEHGGSDVTFPHPLPDKAGILARIEEFPWMDSLTLDAALEGVQQMRLGTRDRPDLLSISLSTTDAVGHAYGPDSREIHDQVLRVDHWLGWFLDSLATLVPRERIVLALTADHGVSPYPEREAALGKRAGRLSFADLAQSAGTRLNARFQTDFALEFDSGILTADVAALRARGVNVDSLANALAHAARQRRGVAMVYTPRELAAAPTTDPAARRWRRTIPPDVEWLICAAADVGYIWGEGKLRADHGTMNPLDVGVPILFAGRGIVAATIQRAIRSVDIGPTLAAYIGLRPTEAVDGTVVVEGAGGAAAHAPAHVTANRDGDTPRR